MTRPVAPLAPVGPLAPLASLVPFAPIGPFASDAYLPSLPEIECDLNTSAAAASATIQLNWIVLGLMNPVIGVLSDRYGRKNITALFLAVFVAGAIGCAYAPTLPQLMIYRLVMGVGQAVSVIASAVVCASPQYPSITR